MAVHLWAAFVEITVTTNYRTYNYARSLLFGKARNVQKRALFKVCSNIEAFSVPFLACHVHTPISAKENPPPSDWNA